MSAEQQEIQKEHLRVMLATAKICRCGKCYCCQALTAGTRNGLTAEQRFDNLNA